MLTQYHTDVYCGYWRLFSHFFGHVWPPFGVRVQSIFVQLFDWKDDYIESKGGADGYFVQKADFGVVAQDVQKVFPIAVRTREDGSLAVDYEKLGALAFAALVELTKRVEALEAK